MIILVNKCTKSVLETSAWLLRGWHTKLVSTCGLGWQLSQTHSSAWEFQKWQHVWHFKDLSQLLLHLLQRTDAPRSYSAAFGVTNKGDASPICNWRAKTCRVYGTQVFYLESSYTWNLALFWLCFFAPCMNAGIKLHKLQIQEYF